jgi:hypothetical protein
MVHLHGSSNNSNRFILKLVYITSFGSNVCDSINYLLLLNLLKIVVHFLFLWKMYSYFLTKKYLL